MIRANALEDQFPTLSLQSRAAHADDGGRQTADIWAMTRAANLGQAGSTEGWLNDKQLIDHRDSRFTAGRIGLWTKADSITAFDSLTVLPIEGG